MIRFVRKADDEVDDEMEVDDDDRWAAEDQYARPASPTPRVDGASSGSRDLSGGDCR